MSAAAGSAHPPATTDRVLRAMTNDGSFRVLVARTTSTVQGILASQAVQGTTAAGLADVVTAAILIRETMAPAHRLQVVYQGQSGTQLVGDAFPDGNTRGLARVKEGAPAFAIEPGDTFLVERIVRAGGTHQGILEIEEGDDFVFVVKRYFLQSEQVTSMLDLAHIEKDGAIVDAAGYVIQLLPELTDPPLQAMNARLAAIGKLTDIVAKQGAEPETILAAVLGDAEEYSMLADSEVRFGCPCNRDRVRVAAGALGRDEIKKLLAEEEDLSISCDYCREPYKLGVVDYRKILDNLQD